MRKRPACSRSWRGSRRRLESELDAHEEEAAEEAENDYGEWYPDFEEVEALIEEAGTSQLVSGRHRHHCSATTTTVIAATSPHRALVTYPEFLYSLLPWAWRVSAGTPPVVSGVSLWRAASTRFGMVIAAITIAMTMTTAATMAVR
jgi:hypothetical protein